MASKAAAIWRGISNMIALEKASVISDKDKEFLGNVREVVRGFQPSAEMLLFGSVARGTQAEESDFDVLILTDSRLSGKEEDEVEDALYDL